MPKILLAGAKAGAIKGTHGWKPKGSTKSYVLGSMVPEPSVSKMLNASRISSISSSLRPGRSMGLFRPRPGVPRRIWIFVNDISTGRC